MGEKNVRNTVRTNKRKNGGKIINPPQQPVCQEDLILVFKGIIHNCGNRGGILLTVLAVTQSSMAKFSDYEICKWYTVYYYCPVCKKVYCQAFDWGWNARSELAEYEGSCNSKGDIVIYTIEEIKQYASRCHGCINAKEVEKMKGESNGFDEKKEAAAISC